MEGIQIKMIDREAVLYLVQELEDFEKDKALRSGLSAAANVFKVGGRRRLRARMKNPAGVKGNLLRSFTIRVKRSKPGALSGFKVDEGADGSHAWLIDQGTKERYHKKSGKSVGRIPGKNSGFQLHFWEDTRNQDYPKAMDKLYQGVERAVQRINDRRK
ncbi:hypothetical protein [Parabacteroides pacaensis]|uniref:hypothetical protein n=1 Tax=Parabacteroides pacaensis TaxID=2086575 RepID=UPI000D0F370D|nr:hypothetical protein [Parabacteroides pacaensis]